MKSISRTALLLASVLLIYPGPAEAAVVVTVEPETLDTVLEGLTAQSAQVDLGGMQVRIVAEEISVERMVPRTPEAEGYVQLRLQLNSPDLGMKVPLEPKLYFDVVESGDGASLELTFREVKIALPTGAIDVSSLMPKLQYPAATLFRLDGAAGPVDLMTTLSDVFVAPEGLRLVLDVATP